MIKHLSVLMLLFCVGCATSGKPIDQDKLSQIKEGITTKQEVIDILGKPGMVTLTSDGKEIMMYQYVQYKTKGRTFVPLVGLMAGGGDMKQQMLQVLIKKEGIVEKFIFNDSANTINTGLLNTGK